MKYYKIIDKNEFVGICTTLDMRKFQKKHNIFLVCDESEAQYVQCNGVMYHAVWMLPVDANAQDVLIVQITEITQSEYNVLYEAIKSDEKIEIEPELVQEEPEEDENSNITISYVKESKIKEMKSKCSNMITTGFDIVLSDGKTYHFSLTLQDQLNLITSSQMVSDGAEEIPYHADGELCKYYASIDMKKIIAKANDFKTYHVAYFNSLKAYINSLRSIDKVAAISYGDVIPSKYQSEVYVEWKDKLGL